MDGYSYVKMIQQSGAALITHSQAHLDTATTSSRIFMAAAGVVIISDLHPFVIREFGDCVLYFDQTQTADLIITQLTGYLKWIKDNPKEAEAKAKCVQDIFLKKFTLEPILIKITEMHETIGQAKSLKTL